MESHFFEGFFAANAGKLLTIIRKKMIRILWIFILSLLIVSYGEHLAVLIGVVHIYL
jgi:hypothetical protein